ncbi:MAG: folP [Firmicutes bacterium]|nr:folP [Bacillota bacterium]
MRYNPRVLHIMDSCQARAELNKINCDPAGINIMTAKTMFKTVKLEAISAKAANLLKQTFLSKGGEVAVARGTADLSVDCSDVLICATLKQYRLAITQLKQQPWGLPDVSMAIEKALESEEKILKREYKWSDRRLTIKSGRTLVMGILNVTPDSFSDGGKHNLLDSALRHAEKMAQDGADIIDIGAESTRPYGAEKVSADEELYRLLPILEKLLSSSPLPVSVDTYKAVVAEAALNLGAHIINDVWGLQYDSAMAGVIAKYGVPVVVMHNQRGTDYDGDVLAHITAFLQRSVKIGSQAGIDFDNIIVDPGIGFGKTIGHNLAVIARLGELKAIGCPILLGSSRKRFIGEILGGLDAGDRVEGTAATVALGIVNGVNIVRVHDVKSIVRVARMTDEILRGGYDGE